MRHQDDRLTRLAEICDDIEHLSGHLGIQRGGGLIQQEKLWIDSERSGNGDSLALTTAKLRRFFAGVGTRGASAQEQHRPVDAHPEIDELFPTEAEHSPRP